MAAAILLTWAGAALADTERWDELADGIEPGDCEVGLVHEAHRASAGGRERADGIDSVCGVGWQAELALRAFRIRDAEGRRDELALEARRVLVVSMAPDLPGLSMRLGLSWEREPGLAWHAMGGQAALEATWRLAPDWQLEATLGHEHQWPERRGVALWQLALDHAAGAAEWSVWLEGDDREPPLAGLGVRWETPWEDLALSLDLSQQFGHPRRRGWELAATWSF